jgi:hypothetical protein
MISKNMTDIALYDGIVTIVFNDIAITKHISAEYEEGLTFINALELAEGYGYTGGVIIMICEDLLSGVVYKYNNYCDGRWHQVGSTCGYA